MANTIPPVLVELQLETASMKAQMEALGKKFDDFGATVKKQTGPLASFKNAALGVFAGNIMTQGLQMVKNTIQGAVQEAQAYEKATAQLNAAIISTGNVAGLSVEGLQQQASALEALSGQDEIAIMKNQALLQTFTNVRNVVGEGNDIFNQATLAMLNMGAKMGDNAGSAMQLGKALNDPVRGISALQRVGVVFTAAQKEQVKAMVEAGDVMGAQKIILKELEVEFGGSAKAAGDTFAGAVARAKDKVSDFARDLVTNLQPALLAVGKAVGDFWNKYLSPLFGWINKNKEAVATFVVIIGTAYAAFKTYAVIMGIITAATELYTVATVLMAGGKLADVVATDQATRAQLMLNAAMTANPIALVVAALALLAAGFVYAWNHSETFRKVVIKAFQGVLSGVSYAIRALSDFVNFANKYLMQPFRTLLEVLSHLPKVGKYAKEALKFMDNIPGTLNNAADKVDSFAASLSKLQDKKITIPGFGGKKEDATTTNPTGLAPGGGLTADQLAKIKADAKAKAKALKDANADVQKIYGKMNDVIKDHEDKRASLTKDYNDKVTKLTKDHGEKKLSIEKDYADKAIALEKKASDDRASIIQKSKDLLINAFAQGTGVDLANLFKDSDKTGAGLVAKMRQKFEAVKKLQQAAGELASRGFSQQFIQDVVSQGPEAGNAMAAAILSSEPSTIAEMRDLYGSIQTVSETGMNELADQMNSGASLATRALLKEYADVSVELKKSLDANNADLKEALAAADKDFQDSLLEAQQAYNDAIDALNKDTMDKLATLQDELKKTAAIIRQLSSAKAAVSALSQSPAAPILAGTQSLGAAPKYDPLTGKLINITINGTNLSDPNATADAVADAIRFGTPQGMSSKIRQLERNGVM